MNICIESQLLNHPRRSGLMTYTEGLVNGLYQNDHENDYKLIYYSLKRSADMMPGPGNGRFSKIVLRVPDQEFFGREFWVDSVALPHFFSQNKIRIFHRVAGYTMPATRNIFKILTIHDLRTLTIGDRVWKQNTEHYRRTIMGLDACVVVSECTRRDLVEHFKVDEQKIKVVYLGADERFKPAAPEAVDKTLRKYHLNHQPFLLSIGSVPRKNIEGIIQGFNGSIFKSKFLLVLSCNINVEKHRQLIDELGLGQRIFILDKLSDEEVVALYTACHCFVFPSLYEGFGLPIIEAMQCGAPVITSNISSCPEVAGDAAILVNPNNIYEISEAINQVCRHDALRKSLIAKGYERAKKFSWENFAEGMKKIYAMA